MFELLNDDLENCIDIIRQMSICETKNEQLRLLAEERIDESDIEKTVELCNLLCYYHEKVKRKG